MVTFTLFSVLVGFNMFMDLFYLCSEDYLYFLLVWIFCLEVLSATLTIGENILYTTLNLECRTFHFIFKNVEISPSNQIASSFRMQTYVEQGIFLGHVLYWCLRNK